MTSRVAVVTGASSGIGLGIATALVEQPLAELPAALPILLKGGIHAVTRALAIEYAVHRIRVNILAPGIVDTPVHAGASPEQLVRLSPAGRIASVSEVVDAALYLDCARFVSGQVLHVDGGAHAGKWS